MTARVPWMVSLARTPGAQAPGVAIDPKWEEKEWGYRLNAAVIETYPI